MKRYLIITALFITGSAFAQKASDLKQLSVLAGGTWQMKTPKGITGETWKKSANGDLNSEAYKLAGKDTIKQETVQLVKKTDGVYYISTVKNQNGAKPVPFKLVSSTNNEFIFTNAKHDFPQRIIYHIITPDSLHAWIDGQYDLKYIKRDFYYKRVK